MAETATVPAPFMEETAAAHAERAKLRVSFFRVDIVLFLLCTMISLDTIGSVASYGGEAITWLVVLAIVFYLPQALIVSELTAAFPAEGGPYVWTRLAFGRLVASVNNFLYWVSNPVWLGGSLTITAIATVETFFHDGNPVSRLVFYAIALPFIWLGVLTAVFSVRIGKWFPSIGAAIRLVLIVGFGITVVIYGIKNGIQGIAAHDLKPSWLVFLTLTPVLLFNLVGFEVPSNAAEEMKDPQRDVPFAAVRAGILTVLAYALPVVGILVVLPTSSVTNLGGFVDAIRAAFTVFGGSVAKDGTVTLTGTGLVLGDIAAVLFILALLTSAAPWLMGSDRALAVSGYDGAAPRSLGVISARLGTPVRVNILSGVVSTVVCVLARELTGQSSSKYFAAVLGLALSLTFVSYLFIIPSAWILRRRRPDVPRPYRFPGGYGALVASTISVTAIMLLGLIVLLYPGFATNWLAGAKVDDALPDGWAGQRWGYTLTQIIPLVAFIALGLLFYASGRRTR